MKNKTFIQTIAIAAMVSTGAMWNNVAVAANFTNGDFSSGFDSWESQDDNGDYNPVVSNANFDASSGQAVLTTDFDTGGNFAASIFQIFTVQNLTAAGNTLTLGFDFTWDADDEIGGDILFAQLSEYADIDNFIDFILVGGSSFDITQFAGKEVELFFGLENFSGADDSLFIDNISITQNQTQTNNVPEPASILLMTAGMVAMRRKLVMS